MGETSNADFRQLVPEQKLGRGPFSQLQGEINDTSIEFLQKEDLLSQARVFYRSVPEDIREAKIMEDLKSICGILDSVGDKEKAQYLYDLFGFEKV
jgi:hypothetical protein